MNHRISEELLGLEPVVLRRRVKWGECDPAGVVYTPVFSEYAVSAFWAFLGALLGQPLQDALRRMDVTTPVRALSFDFKQSLYPDQIFDTTVLLRELHNTTFSMDLCMTDERKQVITDVSLTAICVHHQERKSRAIPMELRELLVDYQRRCSTLGIDAR